MERDAHYAAVGIATIALLAALAVFSIWLARLQFNSEYDLYDIVFYGPVSGVSEGSEVHFNGIRFGEVTDLNLDPEQGNQVVARVRLEADLPIRVTSRAQLIVFPSRAVAAERTFTASMPAGENRVSAIVAAFDSAIADLNTELVAWTETQSALAVAAEE